MNDLIVFAVGLIVSMLVIFGIFSRVPMGMHDAKEAVEGKITEQTRN